MSLDVFSMNISQLLQPELFDESELRTILKARCIQVNNIDQFNKEQLLNLYYRVAIPLQQRNRPENGRKPNGTDQKSEEKKSTKDTNNISPSLSTNRMNGRVKVAGENEQAAKRIKLTNGTINKVQLKRTYSYDSNSSSEETPRNKKARQKICWP